MPRRRRTCACGVRSGRGVVVRRREGAKWRLLNVHQFLLSFFGTNSFSLFVFILLLAGPSTVDRLGETVCGVLACEESVGGEGSGGACGGLRYGAIDKRKPL